MKQSKQAQKIQICRPKSSQETSLPPPPPFLPPPPPPCIATHTLTELHALERERVCKSFFFRRIITGEFKPGGGWKGGWGGGAGRGITVQRP